MTSAYDAAVIDAALLEDERLLAVDRSTRLLHVEATVWSKSHRTDGRISVAALRRLTDIDDPKAAARALVDAGLWQISDAGYLLLDYDGRQMLKADVERRIEGNRKRQREWYDRRPNTSPNALDNASPNDAASLPARQPARKGRQAGGSRNERPASQKNEPTPIRPIEPVDIDAAIAENRRLADDPNADPKAREVAATIADRLERKKAATS